VEALFLLLFFVSPVAVVLGVVWVLLSPERRAFASAGFHRASRSLGGRVALMCVTGLVLAGPLSMVDGLRSERSWRLEQVQREIAQQWGGAQQVSGPVLLVPVEDAWDEDETNYVGGRKEVTVRRRTAMANYVLLPDTLKATGDVAPRSLHRGLYDVLVYDAQIDLDARFSPLTIEPRLGHSFDVRWSEAQLVVGISELAGVSEVRELAWQGTTLHAQTGGVRELAVNAFHAPIPGFDGEVAEAHVAFSVRGTGALRFTTAGEQTDVEVRGAWSDPGFEGFTLPEEREVSDTFRGLWTVPGVARPVPRQLVLGRDVADLGRLLDPYWVGVALTNPTSAYVGVERSLAYAFLIIGLTLLVLLVSERVIAVALHPVQWVVNGFALVTFYLVLLAGSEHLGFAAAYTVAASLVVVLVGGYTAITTRSARAGALIATALGGLYGVTWVMLRSEDQALLIGTGLVVAALVGLMGATRRIGA